MELTIEKAKFHQISLKQVSEALKKGLSKNYIKVDVSIVKCPDLRKWDCPAEGISGNQRIIDVGGEPYMHDKRFIGKEFNYEEIAKRIGSEKIICFRCGIRSYVVLRGSLWRAYH